ncbi:MAG: hypothetical protein Q7U02_04395 [Desulfosalsimonadaceae bacterium]|nr:hypothetical protein [Desulfosalsimonadaceae bacterium]
MKHAVIFKKILTIFIFAGLLVQVSACGTLIYPERRGQHTGRIDVGVAVLDGIGLLFFLIPGIVAYAVDFSTGAIYLPGGGYAAISDTDEITVVHVNPAELNETTIRNIVIRETGIPGTLDLNKAEVFTLNGSADVPGKFAEMKKSGYRSQDGKTGKIFVR